MLPLNCITHIYIFHQEHLWSLTYIWHLWNHCILNDCLEGTNFINTGFCCISQDGIYHTHYFRFFVVVREQLLGLIYAGIHLQDFPQWYLTEYESIRWYIIPLFGEDSHHDTSWCILNIHQNFVSYSIRIFIPIFYLFHLTEFFCTLFEICLVGELNVSCIVDFTHTIIGGNVVKVSLEVLYTLFFFAFIIPSFPMLGEH